MACLVLRVDPMTARAGADFPGLKCQPITFTHYRGVVCVGKLPGHGAPRGDEHGHGTIRTELGAGQRSVRWRRIISRRIMEMLRDDATACARARRSPVIEAAQLVCLKN